jgi:hypothetical protein
LELRFFGRAGLFRFHRGLPDRYGQNGVLGHKFDKKLQGFLTILYVLNKKLAILNTELPLQILVVKDLFLLFLS